MKCMYMYIVNYHICVCMFRYLTNFVPQEIFDGIHASIVYSIMQRRAASGKYMYQ